MRRPDGRGQECRKWAVWAFPDEPKESGCDWINRQKNGRLWQDASAKFSARSDGGELRRTRLSLNRDRLAIVAETDTKASRFPSESALCPLHRSRPAPPSRFSTRSCAMTRPRERAMPSMKTLLKFNSRPGARPIQPGAASRHPAGLQAETLDRIDGVACACGIDRRLRAGVPRYASTNAVTLTSQRRATRRFSSRPARHWTNWPSVTRNRREKPH
jgi:hypothetical protein